MKNFGRFAQNSTVQVNGPLVNVSDFVS